MRFNIISNLTNGVGLQQDYVLLRRELEVVAIRCMGCSSMPEAAVIGAAGGCQYFSGSGDASSVQSGSEAMGWCRIRSGGLLHGMDIRGI